MVWSYRIQKRAWSFWNISGSQWDNLPPKTQPWWTTLQQHLQQQLQQWQKTTSRALKNSYKGKPTNGPKVQCKFCFGPREIFQIHKLLEEIASNSEWYAEVKAKIHQHIHQKLDRQLCTHWQIRTRRPGRTGGTAHWTHNPWNQPVCLLRDWGAKQTAHVTRQPHTSCYDPSQYYKDIKTNSCVHEIYTTTIGYDTGTVFPPTSQWQDSQCPSGYWCRKELYELGYLQKAQYKSPEHYFWAKPLKELLVMTCLPKEFTFDFTINKHTFTNSFIVCKIKKSRPIILGRDFSIPNTISVELTRHGTQRLCTDDKLVLRNWGELWGKNSGTIQVHLHST